MRKLKKNKWKQRKMRKKKLKTTMSRRKSHQLVIEITKLVSE